MSYFLVKCNLKRGTNAKIKKESYVVKSESLLLADAKVMSELTSVDPDVKITDINLKNYVAVFTNGDGPWYDVNIEFEDNDGKTLKEMYLQQANATAEAETLLLENLGGIGCEIVNTKKTTIVDYFITE